MYDTSVRTVQINLGLLFFGSLYFIVELILNYSIYQQLAVGSTGYSISVVEYWGKIITGMGMALLLTRALFYNPGQLYAETRSSFLVFIFCCVVTIPFSFWLQNYIVE